jgi:diguanylate cyclase (GGDEF)-like protein
MIDLDHPKRVNDTMGHGAGDQVLRLVAQHSQAALRDTDVLTRWGGEEFLLLLPDTEPADAERVVERLRIHMSSEDVWRERPELRVTFSGRITAHLEGEKMQETLSRADAKLYEAKAQGRNRALVSA